MGTAEGGGTVMFARTSGATSGTSVSHRPQLQPRRHNMPPNQCGSGGPHQCGGVPDDPRHHGFFRGGHLVGLQRLQHHLNGNPSGIRWGQSIPHHLHHHPHHHHHHMVTPPPEPQQHHWYPWAGPKKESGGAAVGGYVGGGGGGGGVGGGGGPQPLGLVGGGAVVGGGGGAPLVGEKPSKEEEEALWSNVEAQAAFLGPNLWDRTLPYDADLKEYVDLDEFLSENGIPVEGEAGPGGEPHAVSRATASSTPPHHQHQQTSDGADHGEDSVSSIQRRAPSRSPRPESYDGGDERHYPQDDIVKAEHQRGRLLRCSPQPPLSSVPPAASDADTVALLSGCVAGPPSPAGSDFSMSSSTTTTGHDFDPRTRAFSDEELKPQPMIKKSKKQFVPDDLKDEKYWARRRKNNMAAKRSRDARRVKENQIALRAGFLEKENVNLRQELERLKKENNVLRDRLTKYTEV